MGKAIMEPLASITDVGLRVVYIPFPDVYSLGSTVDDDSGMQYV
jgi:hypothetical protein